MRALANFALLMSALALAVLGGIGSAWYMVEKGSPLTTERHGPWRVWTAAGKTDADPYTKAHVARSGRLPIGGANAHYYVASTDSKDQGLSAGCEYMIEGSGPNALWWSLAVYDRHGQLYRNEAQRYAYNSTTVMRSGDGSYQIYISSKARPGNWLPVTGSGPMTLVLRVYEPRPEDNPARAVQVAAAGGAQPVKGQRPTLPEVRKVTCR